MSTLDLFRQFKKRSLASFVAGGVLLDLAFLGMLAGGGLGNVWLFALASALAGLGTVVFVMSSLVLAVSLPVCVRNVTAPHA